MQQSQQPPMLKANAVKQQQQQRASATTTQDETFDAIRQCAESLLEQRTRSLTKTADLQQNVQVVTETLENVHRGYRCLVETCAQLEAEKAALAERNQQRRESLAVLDRFISEAHDGREKLETLLREGSTFEAAAQSFSAQTLMEPNSVIPTFVSTAQRALDGATASELRSAREALSTVSTQWCAYSHEAQEALSELMEATTNCGVGNWEKVLSPLLRAEASVAQQVSLLTAVSPPTGPNALTTTAAVGGGAAAGGGGFRQMLLLKSTSLSSPYSPNVARVLNREPEWPRPLQNCLQNLRTCQSMAVFTQETLPSASAASRVATAPGDPVLPGITSIAQVSERIQALCAVLKRVCATASCEEPPQCTTASMMCLEWEQDDVGLRASVGVRDAIGEFLATEFVACSTPHNQQSLRDAVAQEAQLWLSALTDVPLVEDASASSSCSATSLPQTMLRLSNVCRVNQQLDDSIQQLRATCEASKEKLALSEQTVSRYRESIVVSEGRRSESYRACVSRRADIALLEEEQERLRVAVEEARRCNVEAEQWISASMLRAFESVNAVYDSLFTPFTSHDAQLEHDESDEGDGQQVRGSWCVARRLDFDAAMEESEIRMMEAEDKDVAETESAAVTALASTTDAYLGAAAQITEAVRAYEQVCPPTASADDPTHAALLSSAQEALLQALTNVPTVGLGVSKQPAGGRDASSSASSVPPEFAELLQRVASGEGAEAIVAWLAACFEPACNENATATSHVEPGGVSFGAVLPMVHDACRMLQSLRILRQAAQEETMQLDATESEMGAELSRLIALEEHMC